MSGAVRRAEAWLLPLLGGALVVAAWHFAVVWSGSKVLPSPEAVARAIGELGRRGVLPRYVRDSLVRVAIGYGLAALAGVPLGALLGRHRASASAVNPVIQLLRPISPLAWIPIAILVFGVGSVSAVFLIFLGAFFPIATATANGVAQVPAMYVNAGRNFGLSPAALLRRVILPAALPEVLGGLRVALGVAWLVVVAAEMIAVDSGLGYLIIDARNAGKRYDLVVAGMVLIGAIGLGLDLAVRRVERMRSVRWGFRNQ